MVFGEVLNKRCLSGAFAAQYQKYFILCNLSYSISCKKIF